MLHDLKCSDYFLISVTEDTQTLKAVLEYLPLAGATRAHSRGWGGWDTHSHVA